MSTWPLENVEAYGNHVHPMSWYLKDWQVKAYEDRLEQFNTITSKISFDSADTNIRSGDFATHVETLAKDLTDVHREYTQNANRESLVVFDRGGFPSPLFNMRTGGRSYG